MKSKIIYFCIVLLVLSCKTVTMRQETYDIHADVRLGERFYSIFLDKDGYGYVAKGTGSYYTSPLTIDSSVNSNMFKVDSIKGLISILDQLTIDSTIKKKPMGTIPRVEIYYKNVKVYDAYRWDQSVWNGLRPIISQLPHGFNPFLASDNPFE